MSRGLGMGLICVLGLTVGQVAWADGIVLVNGDTLHGEVVSLDREKLVLNSKTFGEVALPRREVSSIHFGDVRLDQRRDAAEEPAAKAEEAGDTAAAALGQTPKTPEDLIGQLTGRKVAPAHAGAAGADDVLKQLQSGGLSSQALKEVQTALPLLNTPQVQEYFNSTVGGLMGGKLNIQDVRKDAVKARDMILDLKKDLGPGADALNGYLSILEGFIDETAPAPGEAGEEAAVAPRE